MDENIVKFQEKLRELVSLGKKKKRNPGDSGNQ